MNRKNFISLLPALPFMKLMAQENEPEQLEPTCDPYVFIEEKRIGYVRYREIQNGEIVKRWEVHGICTGKGKCYEGAANYKPILDCPVNEHFKNDCCPLKVHVLDYGY